MYKIVPDETGCKCFKYLPYVILAVRFTDAEGANNFIDTVTCKWNYEKIMDIFHELRLAHAMPKQPLSREEIQDVLRDAYLTSKVQAEQEINSMLNSFTRSSFINQSARRKRRELI